jgi:hypothetical protein
MVGLYGEGDHEGSVSAAILRAFDEQNTSELRIEARRSAESRVRYVRDAGHPVPKNYATELVDDALTDTRIGIARWDPARCLLLVHIRGLIRERTAKEVRHGRRFQRVPIHVAANDSPDGLCVEHAPLPSRESSSAAFVGLVFRLASELKRITHGDANAQKVLGCWHAGIVERDAVMARTGLTLAAYKATRKRLFSFSKRLSPELGESTRDVLRSAS